MPYPSKEEIEFVKNKTGYDIGPNSMTKVLSYLELDTMRKAINEARKEYEEIHEAEQKRIRRKALPASLLQEGIAHFTTRTTYDHKETYKIEGALLIIAGIMLEEKDKN